jgi:serine/threonine protein kinase
VKSPMALVEPVPVGERYLLVRRLATGGVADIFLARQSATAGFEKEIVIKRLRPELRGNARVVKMFLEEARIGALLNHPNVVHVYDVDVADGAPYIAMEYIVGGELGALCRRGLAQKIFLPLPHAVELVRQAASGMGYLHAKRDADDQSIGIVHRDVSPNNLLVTEDGFLKIIDFGIATSRRSDSNATRGLPGKLSYMSPEQVARAPVDHRSDIFSLGVVLYEITLGRRLFKGPAHDVVKRIADHAIEPPSFVRRNYPAALEIIVMRALARNPADRYDSAYDLADELEQFLHDAKLASGPVRIARYLDELGHAEGKTRRPELLTGGRFRRPESELGGELDAQSHSDQRSRQEFSSFRAAPGREWDDAEEPMADVASALGIDVAELRAMRVPAAATSSAAATPAAVGEKSSATAPGERVADALPSELPAPVAFALPSVAESSDQTSEPAPHPGHAERSTLEPAAMVVPRTITGSVAPVNGIHRDLSTVIGSFSRPGRAGSQSSRDSQSSREDGAEQPEPPSLLQPTPPLPISTQSTTGATTGATFGATFVDRCNAARPRWIGISIAVAVVLLILYLLAA